ncbi:MAG: mechanosensitive ion channel family protein, partial [Candidatus Nanohaloarchaeota archaeon]|nr:mechanosensitive ion channel family protein [Candidatus Nanohaloarchaeota archaeon]
TETDLDDHLLPFLESLVKITVLVIVFLQILSTWNVEITPLLASAGLVGIAIALAAQETVKNLFGGVSIYVDKNLKIGDWIMLDGKKLKVIDLGVRSTKFLTLDNTLMIVPNSILASRHIENLSNPDMPKKVKVNFGVAYGSDVSKVKKIVEKVVKSHPKVIKDSVAVWFLEMGDFSLNFMAVAEVENLDDVFSVKCDLTEAIYNELNKQGIEIPFPTHTVYLKKDKENGS